jgi:hypothetical protein
MSDPMTNVEIEDVLSSIRRLVSEDLRGGQRGAAPGTLARGAPPAEAASPALSDTAPKLVLTPAQRVVPPAETAEEETAAQATGEAAAPMPAPSMLDRWTADTAAELVGRSVAPAADALDGGIAGDPVIDLEEADPAPADMTEPELADAELADAVLAGAEDDAGMAAAEIAADDAWMGPETAAGAQVGLADEAAWMPDGATHADLAAVMPHAGPPDVGSPGAGPLDAATLEAKIAELEAEVGRFGDSFELEDESVPLSAGDADAALPGWARGAVAGALSEDGGLAPAWAEDRSQADAGDADADAADPGPMMPVWTRTRSDTTGTAAAGVVSDPGEAHGEADDVATVLAAPTGEGAAGVQDPVPAGAFAAVDPADDLAAGGGAEVDGAEGDGTGGRATADASFADTAGDAAGFGPEADDDLVLGLDAPVTGRDVAEATGLAPVEAADRLGPAGVDTVPHGGFDGVAEDLTDVTVPPATDSASLGPRWMGWTSPFGGGALAGDRFAGRDQMPAADGADHIGPAVLSGDAAGAELTGAAVTGAELTGADGAGAAGDADYAFADAGDAAPQPAAGLDWGSLVDGSQTDGSQTDGSLTDGSLADGGPAPDGSPHAALRDDWPTDPGFADSGLMPDDMAGDPFAAEILPAAAAAGTRSLRIIRPGSAETPPQDTGPDAAAPQTLSAQPGAHVGWQDAAAAPDDGAHPAAPDPGGADPDGSVGASDTRPDGGMAGGTVASELRDSGPVIGAGAGHPEAVVVAPGEDDDAGEDSMFAPADDLVIDADALRDLVAEIIRQELQGPLGERITRNVRKLVRREINRALEGRTLE